MAAPNLIVNPVAGDDIINATELSAGIRITGTCAAGTSVTINGARATVSGTSWTYTLTSASVAAMGQGAETLSIVATNGPDMESVMRAIVIDTQRPTATVTLSDRTLAAGETAIVTITFSEPVTGFTAADLVAPNGTLSEPVTADGGKTWTSLFTPTANVYDTTNVITLNQAGVADLVGNAGSGTVVSANYILDPVGPTATIAMSSAAIKAGGTAAVTITFSERVEGFSNDDLSVEGGTLSALTSSDGRTWRGTFTPNADTEDATNLIHIDMTGLTDAAGNTGAGSVASANYAVDTKRPTAELIIDDDALTAGESTTITIKFSEAVTGFTKSDLSVQNGTLTNPVSSDGGKTWTATLTPTANLTDATNVITLNNVGVTDLAGNAGVGSTVSDNYEIDTRRPTATVTMNDRALKAGESAIVTVTFSEVVDGVEIDDFSAPSGALSDLTTADGRVWTMTFTPSEDMVDATNAITFSGASVVDLAGNAGAGTISSANYTVDTVRPTATITVADDMLTAGETTLVTIKFSEAVTGFSNTDLIIAGGTMGAVRSSDGGITWTATLTPTANTENVAGLITLRPASLTDLAGNANVDAAVSNDFSVDTRRPTVTVTMSDNALSAGEAALVTFTFSEVVTGFSNADVLVQNGTLSTIESNDGGTTYTAMLTPNAGVTDATNLITVNRAGVIDLAGNAGTGSATSGNYTIDSAGPTATVSMNTATIRAGGTAQVTITFSERVANFSNEDVLVDNGTLSNLTSSDGRTWRGTLTPDAGVEDATNLISIDMDGLTDVAGNSGVGEASSPNYIVDTVRPTATITMSDSALAAGETAVVTIEFSEPVLGFTRQDLTVQGGTLTNPISTDGGKTWTATLTPTANLTDATNIITLSGSGFTDVAGNTGTGTITSENYAIDAQRPTATILLNDTALKIGDVATATITFSEAVEGFSLEDVTAPNGDLSDLYTTDGGKTWKATLTPTAETEKTGNVIAINMAGVTDIAGNVGAGTASSPAYTVDTKRPGLTITVSDTALSAGETAIVTFSFSEAVTGFTNADLTVENATLSTVASGDGGRTFTGTLTPAAGVSDDSNVLTVNMGGVADRAGNAGAGSMVSANYTIDSQRPYASIAMSDATLKAGETSLVTFTFSKPVTGFTNDDITVENGTLSPVETSDGGKTWVATFTPAAGTADATNVITVANAGVTDAAGNVGAANSTSANYAVDTVAPTVTITMADVELKAGETSQVTFTFSEKVTDFTNADITVENGTLTAVASSDGGTVWRATFTPSVNVEKPASLIKVNMAGVTDIAGNAGVGEGVSPAYAIDTLRPTATITLADTSIKAGATTLVTVTFSEPVGDFTNADLNVSSGSLSTVTTQDGGKTWTATFTPTVNLTDTSNVIVLANTGVTDAAGNAGTGSTQSANYIVDTQVPTAAMSLSDKLVSAADRPVLTITFSEAVTGLSLDDLTVEGGTLSAPTTSDGGKTWKATFTPAESLENAANAITLDMAGVADMAGNAGLGILSSGNYAVDTVKPTVTISISDNALSIGENAVVTFSFSEAVSDFTSADLSVSGGSMSPPVSTDGGKTWISTLAPQLNTTISATTVTLAADSVVDAAGNKGGGSASPELTIDTQRPTAMVLISDNKLSKGEVAVVTFAFSEPVAGFTLEDVVVQNGTLSAPVSADGGKTWTSTFTPAEGVTDTSNMISLAMTGVKDLLDNAGSGTVMSANYEVDTVGPSATITLSDALLKTGDAALVTVTFSEAVSGFDNDDVVAPNATLAPFATSNGGKTWTTTMTPHAEVSVDVNALTVNMAGVTDGSGNAGTSVATSPNYVVDTVKPTATIELSTSMIKAGESATVTFTFSEPVLDFNTLDLTVTGGSISNVASADGGKVWTGTLVPVNNAQSTGNLITVRAAGVTDAAGNTLAANAISAPFAVDTLRPNATITMSDNSIKMGEVPTITFAFSEPVTDFTLEDLTFENGIIAGLDSVDGGKTWTANFVPYLGVTDPTNLITLNKAGISDLAGNAGLSSVSSPNFAIDTAAPVIAVQPVAGDNIINAAEASSGVKVTGTLDSASSVLVNGSAATISGATWSYTLSAAAINAMGQGDEVLTITASDAAGNAASTTHHFAVDTVAPEIAITSPALTEAVRPIISGTAETGASVRVTVAGATYATTAAGGVWHVNTGSQAPISGALSINANGPNAVTATATDAAGNASVVATQTLMVDVSKPQARVTVSDTSLMVGETALVTIAFDEVVTGLGKEDIQAENGTISTPVSSDGGKTWTVTYTPNAGTQDATNVITFDNTGVLDVASNTGEGASLSPNIVIDNVSPTASITLSSSALGIGQTATVTIAFSETVKGFANNDVAVASGTLSTLTSADGGITWTGTFTPTANLEDVTNIITVDTAAVTDDIGNPGAGVVSSANYVVDTKRPTAVINLSDSQLLSGSTATLTVQFSEAVTGFDNGDLILANGSLSEMASSNGGRTWTGTFTPTPGVEDATNVITLNLLGVTDLVGNAGTGTASTANYLVDTKVPSGVVSMLDAALSVGETSQVRITFLEPVMGIDTSDLTLENGTITSLLTTDGGLSWTGTFTPTADLEDATNAITLNNAGVYDIMGNAGTGTSLSPNYTIDTKRPTSMVNLSDTALKAGETAVLTVSFSEAVTDFTLADISVASGALSNLSSADGGYTYTATFTPGAGIADDTNLIIVNNTGVQDAAGNTGFGSALSPNYTVDTVRPTAAVTLSDDALVKGETAVVTFTFSEPVTGLTAADVTIENGTLGTLSSSDGGLTWVGVFTPQANIEDPSNAVVLNQAGVEDFSGNAGIGDAVSSNFSIDTKAPGATITMSDNTLTAGDTALVTIQFSEPVKNFSNADLVAQNGTLSPVSSPDGGLNWVTTFTALPGVTDMTNVITLNMVGVDDLSGNPGVGTVVSANYTIDTTPPMATVTMSDSELRIGETSLVTITFDKVVSDFTLADITVENGVLSALTTSDNKVYTATFTPAASVSDPTNVITIDNAGVRDLSNNPGQGLSISPNYAVDTVRPTAAISMNDTTLRAGETSLVTFSFSERVTGFTNADITVQGGTLSTVSTIDGGATWTGTLTPTANTEDATNVISVGLSGVQDVAGNAGTGTATSGNFTIDTKAPTATITLSDPNLKAGETAQVTVAFSEVVTGFSNAALIAENGSLSTMTTSDGGKTWAGTFTPAAPITDATNVITLNLAVLADLSGNPGGGTTSSSNYAIDTAPPTLTISMSDYALKIGETATVTFAFSEVVTDFAAGDITVTGGALGALSSGDGGKTWTGTFTPTANLEAVTNAISVNKAGVLDLAGNPGNGTASTPNYAVDTKAPTVTISMTDTALKAGETAVVTFTFNEVVSGFTNADLTVVGGALSTLSTVDNKVYTATFTPGTDTTLASNVITLAAGSVTDLAGNANAAAATSPTYAVDTLRPTGTITLSDYALRIGETATVTIAFSESVTAFSNADVTVQGGTLSAVTSADGGITWTANFVPNADTTIASAQVAVNLATLTDLSGNAGIGSVVSPSYAVDTLRPTLGIALADMALKAGETSLVTFTFSEAVTGFTNADITVEGGTLSAVASGDGGLTYTALFTPTDGLADATNVITVNKAGVLDLAGNAGSGTTSSPNFVIDSALPTATVIMSDTAIRKGEVSTVTFSFSEAVTNFSLADVTVSGGSLSAPSSSNGGVTWTCTFTPTTNTEMASGALTLNMATVDDLAGNAGSGTASVNYAIDTRAPTATVTISDGNLTYGETGTVTVTFTEPVNDINAAALVQGVFPAIVPSGGSLTPFVTADGGVTWTSTFTPDAINGAGSVTVVVSAITDAAGNPGEGTSADPGDPGNGVPAFTYEQVSFAILNGVTTINGTAAADALTGTPGRDLIYGLASNDTLYGYAENDMLDGGAGTDTMYGGAGDDTYYVDATADVCVENADEGTDSVISTATYTLSANIENLTINNAAANGTGNALNNTITCTGAFNNVLNGGLGADTMIGGAGNDTYYVDNVGDLVIELPGEGVELVRSTISYVLPDNVDNLTLEAAGGAINGTGNALNNTLTGNASANVLDGGLGADTMNGGNGDDTYVVDNVGDVVTESSATGGTDTVQSYIAYTLGTNVENLTLLGSGHINGTGNALNNIITGSAGNNLIDGGAGADTMAGGNGNDGYIVDNAGDLVVEAENEGVDSVWSSITYTLSGNVENLALQVAGGAINGTGNALNNTLVGNNSANTLNGGLGADTMRGGAGDDTYYVDDAGDVVVEASGEGWDGVFASVSHVLSANVEWLELTGSDHINGTGNDMDNEIEGNNGNNILDGGIGADYMEGESGNDTYYVDNAGDLIQEDAGRGTDSVNSTISYTLAANLENLTLLGTDNINGTGNDQTNILIGNSGNNTLDGGLNASPLGTGVTYNGHTYFVTPGAMSWLSASAYAASMGGHLVTINDAAENAFVFNTFYGTYGELNIGINDAATEGVYVWDGGQSSSYTNWGSGEPNNTGDNQDYGIMWAGGSWDDEDSLSLYGVIEVDVENFVPLGDTMVGGAGNDYYYVNQVGDIVIENAGEGTDTVRAYINYTLGDNVENLILGSSGGTINGTGNALNNSLTGNSSDNVLDGGAGADAMSGGSGNDTYYVDDAGDTVNESSSTGGTDTVYSSVSFTLGNNIENLVLTGSAAINGTGNALANTITGNGAANLLTGGAEADIFVFNTPLGAGNVDIISDFRAVDDTIQLENAIFTKFWPTGALSTSYFKASATGAPGDSNDYICYNTATGALYYDADGNGAGLAVQFATLTGAPTITYADFVII